MGKQGNRRPCDLSVALLMALLLGLGLVTLFSATYYQRTTNGDPFSAVKKQLVGVALGAAACAVLSRVPYRLFRRRKVIALLLAGSALLLVLVIIPGVGVSINGSRRWLNILGMSMQPSEYAKYAMVVFMAGALDRLGGGVKRLFTGVVPVLLVPGAMFLLILEQPNLSTGGSILICALAMLFCAGLRKRHLALLGACGMALGAAYAWSAPYRRARLLSFRDPFARMSDEGYQLSQSLIALGSGGLFGMGLGQGKQKFAYLPYPESDFIFAIVGEDFGLFGCVTVAALFFAFVFCGLRIALNAQDRYGSLLAGGITSMIGLQALINMGVVTGIMPTTGLPLPFFSAGGTSVSMIMAAVGVLLSISRGTEPSWEDSNGKKEKKEKPADDPPGEGQRGGRGAGGGAARVPQQPRDGHSEYLRRGQQDDHGGGNHRDERH